MRFTLIAASLIAALSAPTFVLAQDCLNRRDHPKDIAARQECAVDDTNTDTEAPFPGDTGLCPGPYQVQLCCYGKQGPLLAGQFSYVEGCRFGGLNGGACPAGQDYCCFTIYSFTQGGGGFGTGFTCVQVPFLPGP